jgi:hypothetical protein
MSDEVKRQEESTIVVSSFLINFGSLLFFQIDQDM